MHRWRFFRAGGFDQVQIDDGEDICALPDLDLKLWVALSCPASGIEFEPRTLELLDRDHDGRIRAPDVTEAVRWTCRLLRDPRSLTRGDGELRLDDIDASHPEGEKALASARRILKNLGRDEKSALKAADTVDTSRVFAGTRFNGDGVITADTADNDFDTRSTIELIIAKLGGVKDASGTIGTNEELVARFFGAVQARQRWLAAAPETPAFPTGAGSAWSAYRAVREKVDDFFLRVQLAEMDARATAALNPPDETYRGLVREELAEHSKDLVALPLAYVAPQATLPLTGRLNPAWAERIHALHDRVLTPMLGATDALGREQWKEVGRRLGEHATWAEPRPNDETDHLLDDLDDTRMLALAKPEVKGAIDALLARDQALAPELEAIGDVDRLVHFHQHLYAFLNQFVAFRDFYLGRGKGMFQAGTLYLDGRSAELCIRVEDVAKHALLAVHSMTYLAYCDCVRRGEAKQPGAALPTEKLSIVAAFTAGDSDFLMVGRNGVFFDRKGQDWDATITRVVEQPISVRQAFFAPYKRVSKLVSEQIEKIAGEKNLDAVSALGSVAPAPAPATAPATPSPSFDVAKFAGIFAAIGLALGAVGSAIAAVVSGFLGLRPWQMPIAIAGALLAVSGPSMVLASMKLRQRNLGPLLDASGWAINARARINIPFGRTLTGLGKLPPGAESKVRDPYSKSHAWIWLLVVTALVGVGFWGHHMGYLSSLLDSLRQSAAKHAKPPGK